MCVFCAIVAGDVAAEIIFQDDETLAFLDHRPLFPGHCLLVPKQHLSALENLSTELTGRLFDNARCLAGWIERAVGAQGSFVAVNNKVSQSVPHVHVHVVPRRRKDGLKGFFWPRNGYADDGEPQRVGAAIRAEIEAAGRSGR